MKPFDVFVMFLISVGVLLVKAVSIYSLIIIFNHYMGVEMKVAPELWNYLILIVEVFVTVIHSYNNKKLN